MPDLGRNRQNSDSTTRNLLSRSNNPSDRTRTAITINIYDLLPPGKVATLFWTFGVGLLHTGVAIGDREYAYGGHDRRGITGVYYMKPQQEPPGGTFRISHLQGYTTRTPEEIEQVLREVSEEFQGTSYNVLTRNCNHFTSHLCEKLTGKPAPTWINRAASIGVALPCVVPQAWITPPECEEEVQLRPEDLEGEDWGTDYDDYSEDEEDDGHGKLRSTRRMDEEGRVLPPSERADMRRTVD